MTKHTSHYYSYDQDNNVVSKTTFKDVKEEAYGNKMPIESNKNQSVSIEVTNDGVAVVEPSWQIPWFK